jgi:hypothetical protein
MQRITERITSIDRYRSQLIHKGGFRMQIAIARRASAPRLAALFAVMLRAAAIAGVAGYLIRTPTVITSAPTFVVLPSDDGSAQRIDQGACAFRSGAKGC